MTTRIDNLKQIPLAVGVPFGGRPVVPQWAVAYARQLYPINLNVCHIPPLGAPVAEAREFIIDQALARGCRYVFMWDDDVELPIDGLRTLYHELLQHAGEGVAAITGIYCSKTEDAEPIIYREAGGGAFWNWRVNDVFEIAECGAGCLLIDLHELRNMPRPWFYWSEDGLTAKKGRWETGSCSEDLQFCRFVQTYGKRILAHGGVLCNHWDVTTGKRYGLRDDSFPVRNQKVARALTIPGFMGHNELVWLADQASVRNLVLELGSYQGRSTRAMSDNMKGKLIAFDSFTGIPEHPEMQKDQIRKAFEANLADYLATGHVVLVDADHADPQRAVEALGGQLADMIFIDGDHTYEGCKRDIEFWKQYLAPGGLLCGHDRDWDGVQRALLDLSYEAVVEEGPGVLWFVKAWTKDMRQSSQMLDTDGKESDIMALEMTGAAQ